LRAAWNAGIIDALMANRSSPKTGASAGSPQSQLNHFLAKYTPAMVKESRASMARLRRQVPGAVELVYDNYNALVIGFGPSERASEADLDTPAIRTLIGTALERAKVPIDPTGRRRMVIKSISAKQRPRRPS